MKVSGPVPYSKANNMVAKELSGAIHCLPTQCTTETPQSELSLKGQCYRFSGYVSCDFQMSSPKTTMPIFLLPFLCSTFQKASAKTHKVLEIRSLWCQTVHWYLLQISNNTPSVCVPMLFILETALCTFHPRARTNKLTSCSWYLKARSSTGSC